MPLVIYRKGCVAFLINVISLYYILIFYDIQDFMFLIFSPASAPKYVRQWAACNCYIGG